MGWFGSMQLAFKYALVFGAALTLTLLLGVVKVIIDRIKLRKHLKQQEVEEGRKPASVSPSDEENLTIREKDEGDLFGIRAIEAGFFGGVHQSRPNSVVNSAVNSRGNSPTPSRSTSPTRGISSNNSAHSSTSLLHTRPIRDTRTFSASSSVHSLNHTLPTHQGQQQQHRDPNLPVIRVASQMSVGSDMSITSEMPAQAYSPKLRPSVAELNGRLKHAPVDMALDVPPSPPANGRFPATYRPDSTGSSAGPYSGRSSGGSLAAFQGQQQHHPPPPKKRRSNQRFSSATYHILEEDPDEEATLGSPERAHAAPELVAHDPKADTRSLRASIVGSAPRASGSVDDHSTPYSLRVPTSGAGGRGRPAEQRTGFDEELSSGASASESDSSRGLSDMTSELHLAASEPASSAGSSAGSVQGSDENYTYSDEPSTLVPSTQDNTATGSARTSFSFEYAADGEAGAGGEGVAFTAVRTSLAPQPLQQSQQQQPPISLQQFHQQRLAASGRSFQ